MFLSCGSEFVMFWNYSEPVSIMKHDVWTYDAWT